MWNGLSVSGPDAPKGESHQKIDLIGGSFFLFFSCIFSSAIIINSYSDELSSIVLYDQSTLIFLSSDAKSRTRVFP